LRGDIQMDPETAESAGWVDNATQTEVSFATRWEVFDEYESPFDPMAASDGD